MTSRSHISRLADALAIAATAVDFGGKVFATVGSLRLEPLITAAGFGSRASALRCGACTATLVTLGSCKARIVARGPLPIPVTNRNRFAIDGNLSDRTASGVGAGRRKRRAALKTITLRRHSPRLLDGDHQAPGYGAMVSVTVAVSS